MDNYEYDDDDGNTIALIDGLGATALNYAAFFIMSFLLINVAKAQEQRIETEGRFAIIVEWDDKSPDDVDTYVMGPDEKVVYFSARERGLMHLEWDDRGKLNDDYESPDGEAYTRERNQERVIIRGIVPGKYIVNVHMFNKRSSEATNVKITLVRLRGQDTPVTEKEVVLEKLGDERTAFRFTITDEGEATDIKDGDKLPRKMVGETRGYEGPPAPGEENE